MFRHLKEDIASVFHRDLAARNFVEVLTCYLGLRDFCPLLRDG